MERSEFREVGTQELVGYDKDLGCYSKGDNKYLEILKQEVA